MSLSKTESAPEISRSGRWSSQIVEACPFSGNSDSQFLIRTSYGRQFVVPELLVSILALLDGNRTVQEVAERLSESEKRKISATEIETIIAGELVPRNLVSDRDILAEQAPKRKVRKLDFIFRLPLFSAKAITPITDRLSVLFGHGSAIAALLLIAVSHLWFYSIESHHRNVASQPLELGLAYAVVFGTVVFHEFGHASACRRFRCEHGEVGFCLYLIFPAMYVNLSRAWRLPWYQRAVIDSGGIYFQQIIFVPLLAVYLLFHIAWLSNVLYAIDALTLFSLNPVLKCDGYWLLVDLSRIANLQRRAFVFIQTLFTSLVRPQAWAITFAHLTRFQTRLVVVYSVVLGMGFLVFLPRLISVFPNSFSRLNTEVLAIAALRGGDWTGTITHTKNLLLSVLILPFFLRTVMFLFRSVSAATKWMIKTPPTSSNVVVPGIGLHLTPILRSVLLTVSALFCATFSVIAVHELGHALAAMSLGGDVPFIQLHATGGRTAFYFPGDSSTQREGVTLLAGAAATLLTAVGVTIHPSICAYPRYASFFLRYCGLIASFATMTSIGLPTFRYGEFGLGLTQIGLSGFAAATLCAVVFASALGLGVYHLKQLLGEIWRSVEKGADGATLYLTSVFIPPIALLLIHCLMVLFGSGYGWSTRVIVWVIAASTSLLFLALRKLYKLSIAHSRDGGLLLQRTQWSFSLTVPACSVCLLVALQTAVFGYDMASPRGYFLAATPTETSVRACNIRMSEVSTGSAHVSFAMRSFSSTHPFLWEKVRYQEPSDWKVYEHFVVKNLPKLVDVQSVRLTSRSVDPEYRFFVAGGNTSGARIVEADIVMKKHDVNATKRWSIRVHDFWREQKIGMIDRIIVEAPKDYVIAEARPPAGTLGAIRITPTRLNWAARSVNMFPASVEVFFGPSK